MHFINIWRIIKISKNICRFWLFLFYSFYFRYSEALLWGLYACNIKSCAKSLSHYKMSFFISLVLFSLGRIFLMLSWLLQFPLKFFEDTFFPLFNFNVHVPYLKVILLIWYFSDLIVISWGVLRKICLFSIFKDLSHATGSKDKGLVTTLGEGQLGFMGCFGEIWGEGKSYLPTFVVFSNAKVPYFEVTCPKPHHLSQDGADIQARWLAPYLITGIGSGWLCDPHRANKIQEIARKSGLSFHWT
jgi:hypothetical protein